ncbi:hypothetical protein os4_01850 [Comamonadaceae bacterium OS-4]|nr:hypothetical protein os4_01850 [Comamonadaceae bacterium OS-4]
MKKTIQTIAAAAVLATAANSQAASTSASFEEATNGAFTESFVVTPTTTNKLVLRVTGLASQFSALSASLWSGAAQLATFTSVNAGGNRTILVNDAANSAFSLLAGQAYTFKVTGTSTALPNTAKGAVVAFSGTVSAVPEPESFALLLAGLGLVGVAAKRGRQKSA